MHGAWSKVQGDDAWCMMQVLHEVDDGADAWWCSVHRVHNK